MSTHQLVHLGINHCAIWICEAECARRLHHSNREGCIISNGVQFRPHAHFPSLFTPVCFCFFCLFFPAIAPASTTLVSSPHHTTPQLTALTASDSQNMRPVAFTENLRLFEKNSLLWHINTLPSPSLSFFPLCPSLVLLGFFLFFLLFFFTLMRGTNMLAGLLHSSLLAPFFSSDYRWSRRTNCGLHIQETHGTARRSG